MSHHTTETVSARGKIKVVVFDLEAVIINSWHEFSNVIPDLRNLRKEILEEIYGGAKLRELQFGRITEDEFVDEIRRLSGTSASATEIKAAIRSVMTELPGTRSVLSQLGCRRVLLSNFAKEWFKYLCWRYGLEKSFDVTFISGYTGLKKPSAESYRQVTEFFGVKPEECLLIDDKERNTRAAEEFGMKTILFKNARQLTSELKRLDVEMNPPQKEVNLNKKREIEKLKREYYCLVEKFTPEKIKKTPIVDLNDPAEISLTITKDMVDEWHLESWLKNYKKEATVSTSGIRGQQNILYFWDTRFPINEVGVTLATLAKSLILKRRRKSRTIHKICAGEVRYNTKKYVELISRVQATLGIHTHLPFNGGTTPIWMTSFLIFTLDYDGGEYVTASHSISAKIATKDLNEEGGQFTPKESLSFIREIEKIVAKAKSQGYKITFAPRFHPLIAEDFDGFDLYTDYLRKGVATEANLKTIRRAADEGFKVMFDVVGGCMYRTMPPILRRLGIEKVFDWNHTEEDPFFHGIGKTRQLNPETNKTEFFDLSCDTGLPEVLKTIGYEEILKDKPTGYPVMITDPDGDRLILGQVVPAAGAEKLEELGVEYVKIDDDRLFAAYHPTYSFLMLMNFRMEQLKAAGTWENHPRFIIKTTPSSYAWDEWARSNGIKVVNTPVGFKEIATVLKKIEKQIREHPKEEVIINDVFGNLINLGVQPRLVFGGEESGGMIMGPENLIVSKGGRTAVAMREKSAGEASVIAVALAAHLFNKRLLSEYLTEIFDENKIKYRYYSAKDVTYYNESEPDPKKLLDSKMAGEVLRDKADKFYLGLALGTKEKIIDIEKARLILSEAFPELTFADLEDVIFVGDGTYLKFQNKFVEIRKSGTDAKLKGYCFAANKNDCEIFLEKLLRYNGKLTTRYKKLVFPLFYNNLYKKARELYITYACFVK